MTICSHCHQPEHTKRACCWGHLSKKEARRAAKSNSKLKPLSFLVQPATEQGSNESKEISSLSCSPLLLNSAAKRQKIDEDLPSLLLDGPFSLGGGGGGGDQVFLSSLVVTNMAICSSLFQKATNHPPLSSFRAAEPDPVDSLELALGKPENLVVVDLDYAALFGSLKAALKALMTERDYFNAMDIVSTQKTYDSMDVTGDGGKSFHKCKDFDHNGTSFSRRDIEECAA